MTEKGFEPLTSQLGISGTSYRVQLGKINEKWSSRILKGQNVIDSYIYDDASIEENLNSNLVVGWILRTIAIPNINPYTIMKTVQALAKQAVQNKDKQKVMAPLSETKDIELEKVPEKELKRPKASGWVKEEAPEVIKESEKQKRQAFQERMKSKTSEGESTETKPKGRRELPKIPGSAEGGEGKKQEATGGSKFCPYCGKDLGWRYCPYCGKELPHE